MQNGIVINEIGAIIPREMFGDEERIVNELRQAGVVPPKPARASIKKASRIDMPDRSQEMLWIKKHRKEYAGQWIALDGDRLVSHGLDARKVFTTASESGVEAPFFAHLEPDDGLPFGGW